MKNSALKTETSASIMQHSRYKLPNSSHVRIITVRGISITKMTLLFVWLQATVAQLERQLADCESALVEETVVSQERKHQAEQCQYQVDQL